MSVEPRVTFSYATLLDSESPFGYGEFDVKGLTAVSYGVLLRYKIQERISFHIGYNNDIKGAEGTYRLYKQDQLSIADKTRQVSVRNEYNTIPFFGRYMFGNRNLSFFGDVGGYVSFLRTSHINVLIDEYESDPGATIERNEYYTETEKKYTNSVDYGLVFGAGVEYQINARWAAQFNPQISIGLRKLDSHNSNDRKVLPSTSGPFVTEEDYFHLSSTSKNLFLSFNLGLSYTIRKDTAE